MKKLLFSLLFLPLFVQGQIIVTVAGNGTLGYAGDGGPATMAALNSPDGVTLDASGNLFFSQNGGVRKVSPAYGGTITTIAGNGTSGYSGDGGLAIYAQLNGVHDVAIDHSGNIYLPDGGNHRVRKVTPDGIIRTIAGTGTPGYNGDGIMATAAQLNSPIGITVDDTGNVYIADSYNYRIRKISTTGIISTIAGTGISGHSGDGGGALLAQIHHPLSVKLDSHGNIYFGDSLRIRKISALGIITTFAGNGTSGYSGDGGAAIAAQIEPTAIALDTSGTLYIADGGHHRIRKVTDEGTITSIAGTGLGGYSGDGGSPLLAQIKLPCGIAVSSSGDVFVGDLANDRIRLITSTLGITDNIISASSIKIYPNPGRERCIIAVTAPMNEQVNVMITSATGAEMIKLEARTNEPVTVTTSWPPGVYTVTANILGQQLTGKLVIQ